MTFRAIRKSFGIALLPVLAAPIACHSYHVDTTIENRTGGVARLLEVDYPSASFGTDAITAGANFHYRFQVQGNGPIKIQYTATDGHIVQLTGPTLTDRQEGQLEVVLLPEGRAEFHPQLNPHP